MALKIPEDKKIKMISTSKKSICDVQVPYLAQIYGTVQAS